MLIPRHIACGVQWARRNAATARPAVFATAMLASTAGAQPVDDHPSVDDSVRAFITLRQWTDSFTLPPLDDAQSTHAITGSSGVYIVLRDGGHRVVGSAVHAGDDELTLRRAAGLALASVLSDETVRRVMERTDLNIGPELSVELEVAGPLRPLIGRTHAQLAAALEPGLDGLAMRRGSDLAMLFPAQLRRSASTANLQGNLARLAGALGLKPRPIDELRDRHRVSIYRFRTVHLAQSAPDDPPRTTHRGLQVVGAAEVTPAAVAEFADALAAHMLTRLWPGEEPVGMLGDYQPMRDRYHPMIASPRDQALAAFALLRYAEAPNVDPQRAAEATNAAQRILGDLSRVTEVETEPAGDPAAAAMIICAAANLTEAPSTDGATLDLVHRAAEPLAGLLTLQGDAQADALAELPPSRRAMIALAAVLGDEFHDAPPAAVRALLDQTWATTPAERHVALMPWLGWAELAYSARHDAPLAHVDDMERIRAALWNQQVQRGGSQRRLTGDAGGDWVDLIGGFALTGDDERWGGRPTAQSARPAALLATLLANDALTPQPVRKTAWRSHRQTMRYLMQLAVREDELWAMPRPTRARGGLRASTWQTDQPLAAQALGLLTAAETLAALEQRSQADRAVGWPGQ